MAKEYFTLIFFPCENLFIHFMMLVQHSADMRSLFYRCLQNLLAIQFLDINSICIHTIILINPKKLA